MAANDVKVPVGIDLNQAAARRAIAPIDSSLVIRYHSEWVRIGKLGDGARERISCKGIYSQTACRQRGVANTAVAGRRDRRSSDIGYEDAGRVIAFLSVGVVACDGKQAAANGSHRAGTRAAVSP